MATLLVHLFFVSFLSVSNIFDEEVSVAQEEKKNKRKKEIVCMEETGIIQIGLLFKSLAIATSVQGRATNQINSDKKKNKKKIVCHLLCILCIKPLL